MLDSLWAAASHRSHDQFHEEPLLTKKKGGGGQELNGKTDMRKHTYPRTAQTGSSSWPTPQAADSHLSRKTGAGLCFGPALPNMS